MVADYNTAGSSALEIIKWLPDNAKELPIIQVTDVPLSDAQIQSLKPPVMACLNRPFRFEEILKHVKCSIKVNGYN